VRNKKFRTTSNKWELSIFTTTHPYTSKKYIFQSLKYFFKNENIPFSEFLNSLNLNENTNILSLKRNLTNPHFKNNEFLKT